VKRISPATVTFGVMAIVLGLVAAYVVKQSLHKPPVAAKPAPPAPKPETVPVVFAIRNIPKNTRISAADLFIGQVGKEAKAATGAFRAIPLAEGRISNQHIRAGQAIRDEYLLGIGEGLPDLAERLPAGHRAVTIEVEGADTGGKRIAEGDHIDIAMAVEGTHPDLGEVMTRTLLRNVLVVDAYAGKPYSRGSKRAPESNEGTITVAVEPADANKLLVAERTGTLIATLVSSEDAVAEEAIAAQDDAITRRQLLNLKEVPAPKKFTIEKWSGTSLQILEMSDDRIRESRAVTAGQMRAPIAVEAPPVPSGVTVPVSQPLEKPDQGAVVE
jgi:pilus assembly protein CpaB